MNNETTPIALFRMGHVVITPNALAALSEADVRNALRRHQAGDWGNLDEDDRAANNQALTDGGRLLSSYTSSAGAKFWVITEADRSSTCVLLPEDY